MKKRRGRRDEGGRETGSWGGGGGAEDKKKKHALYFWLSTAIADARRPFTSGNARLVSEWILALRKSAEGI